MSETLSPALPDLRPALEHALDVVDSLVRPAAESDLDGRTPCDDFALRDLLGHLLTVANRVRIVLDGGHFGEVPHVTVVPDAERLEAWSRAVESLRATLPGVDLARPVTAPFGTVPAAAAIASYVGELTTHAWDVAVTIDRRDLLDPDLAAPVLATVHQRIPAEGREDLPFGPVVNVPDDAPVYDRLVGWMGRDPAWTA